MENLARDHKEGHERIDAPATKSLKKPAEAKGSLGHVVPVSPKVKGHIARVLVDDIQAALLRNPDLKHDVWADMKSLREEFSK